MMKYEVLNPFLAFGLNNPRKDYTLKRGDVVELPETNVAVRAMLARGQIKEVTGDTTTAPAKKKTKE